VKKKIFLLAYTVLFMLPVGCTIAQEIAPNFTLTDIDGTEFSLSDYRGRVVLLDFFATWCGPCVAEIPHLKSLHEKFGEDLIIISISVSPSSDTVEKLQEFRQEHGIDWIIARDTIEISNEYDVQFIPTLVIIDQEGYIQHRHVGLTDESVLYEEIHEIIPEFETWTLTIFLFLLTVVAIFCKQRLSKNPFLKTF